MKSRALTMALVVVVIGLLIFLLKENEAKMAAVARLKNTEFKANTLINEKGTAINELETQLGELQAKFQSALEIHQTEMDEKKLEMDRQSADFERKTGEYEGTIDQKTRQLLREHLRAPRGWHRIEDQDQPTCKPPRPAPAGLRIQ